MPAEAAIKAESAPSALHKPRLRPLAFLLRLIPLFFLTYLCWGWVEPHYIQLLAAATRAGVWVTELSTDPLWHTGTTILVRDTAIFYTHKHFAAFSNPIDPQGIPAEWVMANLVLLIPLMLASPAPSWRARLIRLLLALAIALVLQVVDLIVAMKLFYASTFRGSWSPWSRSVYQFLDAFFQSFDTQLFPFAIWAGIHFRELIGLPSVLPSPARPVPEPGRPTTKSKRRRLERSERRRALDKR